jgi:Protein of unknown function (DUF3300)
MAQNGPWTQAVGAAFVSQPAQVMNAIQRLRELARAAGTLTDTPQQEVVVQGSYVEIEPAQPNVIYVPRYDPEVVFVDQPYYGYGGPFISYGPSYYAGAWLTFGCNWRGGGVLIVGPGYWHGNGGWWHPYGGGEGPGGVALSVNVSIHAWGYPANRPAPQAPGGWQSQAAVIHPRLAGGSPAQPPQSAFRNIRARGPLAVAAVAANPAAFKGKPINSAIIAKTPGSSVQRAAVARPPVVAEAAAPARAQVAGHAETDRIEPGKKPENAGETPKKSEAKKPAKPEPSNKKDDDKISQQ